mmetsp:Transcript_21266/g.49504  ORF Transcript_21266/g.49504 Transcript_21266/m.49504 type:complete len:142 (+) Transcript_21266:65-490(+)
MPSATLPMPNDALTSFTGDVGLDMPPAALSLRLRQLERGHLEELAQELFLALKHTDARLESLRRAPKQQLPAAPEAARAMRRTRSGEAVGTEPRGSSSHLPRGRSGPVGCSGGFGAEGELRMRRRGPGCHTQAELDELRRA